MSGKRDFDEYDSEDDHIYSNKRLREVEVDASGMSFLNLLNHGPVGSICTYTYRSSK